MTNFRGIAVLSLLSGLILTACKADEAPSRRASVAKTTKVQTPAPGPAPTPGPTPAPGPIPAPGPSPAPGQIQPPKSSNAAPGLGVYYSCQKFNDATNAFKGFSSTVTFNEANQFVIQTGMHPDGECKTQFSEIQLEQIAIAGNPELKDAAAEQKKAVLDSLKASINRSNRGVFAVTQQANAAGEIEGTFDFETEYPGVKAYSSFRIAGKQMTYLDTCVAEDKAEGGCTDLIGESAQNRAKDFENGGLIILQKK